jgi:nitrite reductase/ring-hydroxylating ferredoxin subunit
MAGSGRIICDSSAVADGGTGVRFEIEYQGRRETGFVIRFDGKVYGYVNLCAHRPIELDFPEGQFFDSSGLYLTCTMHGATYEPATGRCILGPCSKDERLVSLQVTESEGKIFLLSDGGAYG